jgi:hypothetical protein
MLENSISVPKIFQRDELQKQFDEQGFVVIDFLEPNDISKLTEIFYQFHPQLPENRFMSDSYSSDNELKRSASQQITHLFQPYFARVFQQYTPFGSSFLYKTPGINSELAPHQDWTIVDETKAVALNIWVPLCDTDKCNGTLYVIPGSHSHILPLRAPTLPFFFSGKEAIIRPYLMPLKVKAGQAVVLNQRIIHYSAPNLSDKIRIAITSGIKTAGAGMIFYYKDHSRQDDVLEYFYQDDDFLISFNNFYDDIACRPYLGVKGGEINYVLPRPEKEELKALLDKMYQTAGFEAPKEALQPKTAGWWERAKRALGFSYAGN